MTHETHATVSNEGGPNGPNLVLHIRDGAIHMEVNKTRILETLANRLAIAALIQRRLDDLLQDYLYRAADMENHRNRDATHAHKKPKQRGDAQ